MDKLCITFQNGVVVTIIYHARAKILFLMYEKNDAPALSDSFHKNVDKFGTKIQFIVQESKLGALRPNLETEQSNLKYLELFLILQSQRQSEHEASLIYICKCE